MPRRTERDNKYSAGSVLVVGGSRGLTGAPSLTSEAALRAGAGIVTVCVPASLNLVFEQRLRRGDDAAVRRTRTGALVADAADEILAAAERRRAPSPSARASAARTGRGRWSASSSTASTSRSCSTPTALWALAGHLDWVFSRDAPTVLTPHAGELGRLLGRSSAWVRRESARRGAAGADDTGAVVLLKGVDTLVAAPGRNPVVADLGNAGLATAGSGDVLTGVVAAFLAKGLEASLAATAAAAACGVASQLAAERHGQAGMIARDVIESLSPALSA